MKLENLYGNGFKHFSKWDLFSSKMRMNEEFYISLLAKEGKSFYLKFQTEMSLEMEWCLICY